VYQTESSPSNARFPDHPFAARHGRDLGRQASTPAETKEQELLREKLGEMRSACARAAARYVVRSTVLQAGDKVAHFATLMPAAKAIEYVKRVTTNVFEDIASAPAECLLVKLGHICVEPIDHFARMRGAAEANGVAGASREAGDRANRARQLLAAMAARGVILAAGAGDALIASPAHLLSDDDRKKLADQKGELLKLITSREVF
jgi:hypothetical protein